MKSSLALRGPAWRRAARRNTPAEQGRRVARRSAQIRRAALLFVAPAALLFLVLIAYPLLRVLWDSLHAVNLVNPGVTGFAGLDNYQDVLEDEDFWPSLWHTLVWTSVSVAGEYLPPSSL